MNIFVIVAILIALQGFKTDKKDSPPPPTCNVTQGFYQPTGGPKYPMDTNKPIGVMGGAKIQKGQVPFNSYYVLANPYHPGQDHVYLHTGMADIHVGIYNPLHYTTGCK